MILQGKVLFYYLYLVEQLLENVSFYRTFLHDKTKSKITEKDQENGEKTVKEKSNFIYG